jgi:hypothetical protein
LVAETPVEVEPGVVIPPGSYWAVVKEIGVPTLAGMRWTDPAFTIELTAKELAALGVETSPHEISTEYDVTKFVTSRQLVARSCPS